MSAILKIESTKAKARFAALPRQARDQDVAITRHGRIEAYVLSPERYTQLASVARVGADAMATLDAGFDALVARMQTPAHARAVARAANAPLDAILAPSAPSVVKRARKSRKPSV